jgi:uncharacterized cupredoxin-like copper-binding protein
MRSRTLVTAAAVIALLAVAGCGSDDDNNGGDGSASDGTLEVSAAPDGGLSFNPSKLTAKAGAVTIAFENPSASGEQHAVAIRGSGADKASPVVGPGKNATLEVDLEAGDYTFYCPVGGHEKAGMKGTLSVSGSGGGEEPSGGGGGGGGY